MATCASRSTSGSASFPRRCEIGARGCATTTASAPSRCWSRTTSPSRWGSPGSATRACTATRSSATRCATPTTSTRAASTRRSALKVLDAEGIDIAVLYCGLGQSLGGIDDVELAVASHQVWNDWIADWSVGRSRPADRDRGDPAARSRGRGARGRARRTAWASSPASSGPTRCTACRSGRRTSTRCTRRSRRPASRSGLHGAGLFDIDGRQQAHGRPDGDGHASRADPVHRPVHDARRTSSTAACSSATPS